MQVYVQERPLLKRVDKLWIMLYQPIRSTRFLEDLSQYLSLHK
jgi:hypothetical protein